MNKVTPAPPGLELPDCEPRDFVLEEDQNEMYWSCTGEMVKRKTPFWRLFQKKARKVPTFSLVFETADEAEASSACNFSPNGLVWDKEPASLRPLQDYIDQARRLSRLGVVLKKYDHTQGSWVTIKQWLSGVPLR